MSTDIVSGKITYSYPGIEISWAGFCPWTAGPCFGTEDGSLVIPGLGENLAGDRSIKIFDDEAVNDVAFSGDLAAISSRVAVSLLSQTSGWRLPRFEGGAHGVVANPAGGFLASLGRAGLLEMHEDEGHAKCRVVQVEGSPVDFYKLIPLGATPDGAAFACAGRGAGLISIQYERDRGLTSVVGHRVAGIDVVDACSLRTPSHPNAVVGLDVKGRLLFVEDVAGSRPPRLLDFEEMAGPAYSVVSANGHVFVLTATGLVAYSNLASDFLKGAPLLSLRHAIEIPVDASDVFLIGEDELYAIAEKGPIGFRLDDLIHGSIEKSSPLILHPLPDRAWADQAEYFTLFFAA